MARKGPEKLGRYQLLALLATGGMAEIHLARQTGIKGFERLVVVKRILPHLARQERFVEMFFDEARIAAKLSHPNIVQIYDLGQDEDEFFISMEYLEGESLGYLVHESRRTGSFVPPHLAAGILAQVCDGLDYAHKFKDETGKPMNIVHRDVTPHNIIVLFSGGVKLVDFGIVKAASRIHETKVGTMKGKLTYMSPEQCRSEAIDARADVFSLGAILWELLTRRRLFKRDNEPAMIQAIVEEPIPSVRSIRPQIAADLEDVVERALRRNPDERFQSAAEMGAAIRQSLRTTGAAAGVPEIAQFVNRVFDERARTKRRLLEDVRDKGAGGASLRMLKPDTEESFPSRSRLHKKAATGRASVDTWIGDPDAELEITAEKQVRPRSRLPGIVRVGLPLLLVLGIVFLGVFRRDIFGERTSTPTPSNSSLPSEPLPANEKETVNHPPDDPTAEEGFIGLDLSEAQTEKESDAPSAGDEADPLATRPSLLSVGSRPSGCKVKIDGVEVPGTTPLDEVAVDPHVKHRVTLLCAKHEKETRLVSGGPGERIAVDIHPKRIVPPKPKTGALRLNTVPWSEVYLGKRKLGITPLLGIRLPAGVHLLTATNQDRGLTKTFKVTIRPGKTTTLRVRLAE